MVCGSIWVVVTSDRYIPHEEIMAIKDDFYNKLDKTFIKMKCKYNTFYFTVDIVASIHKINYQTCLFRCM